MVEITDIEAWQVIVNMFEQEKIRDKEGATGKSKNLKHDRVQVESLCSDSICREK